MSGETPEASAESRSPFEQAGERIGPYELLAPLGEGGFGTVWRARRTAPFEQIVAVKIVKAGMDSAAVLARFGRERQTLARMDHPGIARVLDGGLTPRGRPCFVMEFVDGAPITEWCSAHAATIRQRVELMAAVADAVQHAHAKSVIHRDLKPSNVLVASGADGVPRAKVIDFGIAKALADDDDPAVTMTSAGQLLGTAEYMSPEQADPDRSGEVDTRTDIYALGAILYELLSGRPPVGEGGGSTRTRLETLRAVRAGQVRPLSERAVPVELSWIAMKALRYAPDGRYASATDLARDLRAWLSGLPVEAAPESLAYRVRSFVRRNTLATAAGAAIAGTLVAATIVSARFGFAEHEAREAAETARNDALAREAEARRLVAFQSRVLGQLDPAWIGAEIRQDIVNRFNLAAKRTEADPKAARARVMTVYNELMLVNRTDVGIAMLDRWILDPISKGAGEEFADLPLTEAALRHGVANSRWTMRQLADARSEVDRALALRRTTLGERDPATIESLALSARIAASEGDLGRAIAEAGAALEVMRTSLPPESDELLYEETEFCEFLTESGEEEQAIPILERVVSTTIRVFGPEDVRTGTRRSALGAALLSAGRLEEAEPHVREGHAIRVKSLGPDARYTIRAQLVVGDLERALGRSDAARATYEDAVARSAKTDGSDHPATARARLRAAAVAATPDAAAAECQAALEALRVTLGRRHPETILAAIALIDARTAMGDADGARALAEATTEDARALPDTHPARVAFEGRGLVPGRLTP